MWAPQGSFEPSFVPETSPTWSSGWAAEVPKFLKDDLPLFANIISDLFPGVEKPAIDYGMLDEMAKEKSKSFNLPRGGESWPIHIRPYA